MTAKIMV